MYSFRLSRFRSLVVLVALIAVFGAQATSSAAQSAPGTSIPAADTALLNGDYPAAVTAYTAAVSDPALKCDALYGLGTAQFRAGHALEAANAFAQQLNECTRTFRAFVMYAQAIALLGRSDEAISAYQAAQALNPVLNSYLYERMAELAPDQSVYYLRLATEADRQPEGKFALREKLAQVYLLVGSPASALAEYDTLLQEIDAYLAALSHVEGAEFDKIGSLRARIELAAADIQTASGQLDAAYARLQHIISAYWQTGSALPALIDLITAGQPVDIVQRMRINVFNANYTPVVSVLTDYFADPQNAASAPAELHLFLGEAQQGLGDAASALATFAALRQQFPSDPASATAMLDVGNIYLANADYPHAIAAFTDLVTTFPQSPEAPQALLSAAETERDHGDLDHAVALYNQLSTQYGASDEAKNGLFEAGMLLRSSDPARAADLLSKVGSARAFVWQGKLLAQSDNTDGARQAWQNAVKAEPGTYFGIRACELLNGREPFTTAPIVTVDTSGDRSAAEAWIRQTYNLPGFTADLSSESASDPMLQRGTELWAVGMSGDARAELDTLHKLRRADPAALLQLAFYYQSVGIYRSSLLAATRLIYQSNQPILNIPDAVLRLAFPIHYADLIVPLSQQNGLDPLLVTALIRQESSFDPTIVSVANARGLMQFVPATAQDMADQLDIPDYTLDDLYRPTISIAFGTHYLSSMRDFQNGSVAGALLSYNAGPGAAQGWINDAGSDLEALYEIIAYAETQSYLDIIYSNHFIYQKLYTQGAPNCAAP